MTIVHISAECYPAAKAGGLGDVVGALPQVSKSRKIPCFGMHASLSYSMAIEG